MQSVTGQGLHLDEAERAMLGGEAGAAVAMAMRIQVRMAEIQGAERFIEIVSAHVDGCAYEGDAIVDFVERLRDLGGRVRVPTTLNAVSVEVGSWRRLHLPEHFGRQATRIVDAYLAMGLTPTFSCSPYQVGHEPGLGQHVAWAESNAIAYANSVLGARTERYGDFLDISAALTGRVPAVGLHLSENRKGQVRFVLADDIPERVRRRDAFWPLLGYAVGERAQYRIPVVEGLPADASADQLKSFLAAAASSGAVALAHLVGITPEAPDLVTAFQGDIPSETVVIRRQDLMETATALNTGAEGVPLDVVALGSPHFSPAEFEALARLVSGRHKAPAVRFLITTSRLARDVAAARGWLKPIEEFGGEVITDTCILLAPLLPEGSRTLMTNSGKYAHYSPGRLGVDVYFGSLEATVRSAEAGRVILEDELWN
jgi:predicted aconitase